MVLPAPERPTRAVIVPLRSRRRGRRAQVPRAATLEAVDPDRGRRQVGRREGPFARAARGELRPGSSMIVNAASAAATPLAEALELGADLAQGLGPRGRA